MADRKQEKGTPELFSRRIAIWLGAVGALSIIGAAFVYFWTFREGDVGGPAEWGQFGDYMAGLTNPLLGFVALLVLIISLRATVHALKQNEIILGLTMEELKQTRVQIENTERALSDQTKIVRANAYSERLGMYAEKIYNEILECHESSSDYSAQLLKAKYGKYKAFNFVDAFNSSGSYIRNDQIRRREEWTPEQWDYVCEFGTIADYLLKYIHVSNLCEQALQYTSSNEMQVFYRVRLKRWATGIVDLGYLKEEEITTLYSITSEEFQMIYKTKLSESMVKNKNADF